MFEEQKTKLKTFTIPDHHQNKSVVLKVVRVIRISIIIPKWLMLTCVFKTQVKSKNKKKLL